MNLTDYPTPETEEFANQPRGRGALGFARNLERRLALCRDALKVFAEYHTGDLSEVGGGTRIGMLAAFKDAKEALTATAPQ